MKVLTGMDRSLRSTIQKLSVFILCFVSCWLSASGSDAEHRVLKIAVFQSRPYGFIGEKGGLQGLSVDQIKAIMKEAKLPYEMTLANFSRIINGLQKGDVDVAILLWSDAALEVAECIDTIMVLKNIVVGKKGTNWSSVTDLHAIQRPVGTSRGARYGEMFDDDTEIPKYPIDSYEQGLQMLFAGRLDAIVGVEHTIYKAAKELGYSRDQFGASLLIKEVKGCIFFSRATASHWSTERQRIKDIAQHLKEKGIFRQIDQHWTQ